MAYTKVYWRPSQVSTGALIVLALISLAGLVMVETMRRQDTKADYGRMVAAAEQTEQAMDFIGNLRQRIQRIDADVDPLESGLIGVSSSPVTSLSGHLPAKQTTINPNWAAVIVRMLREAGVTQGDRVAVAVSGSFPALNLATYAALEQLGAQPIKAYVNIGGGTASTGPASIDQYFEGGVINSAQPKAFAVDSVMGHYLKEDVPVLNISGIATIARRYGLPLAPQTKQPIGSGGVYNTVGYRRWLAGLWVILILVLTYVTTRISGVVSSFESKGDHGGQVRPTF